MKGEYDLMDFLKPKKWSSTLAHTLPILACLVALQLGQVPAALAATGSGKKGDIGKPLSRLMAEINAEGISAIAWHPDSQSLIVSENTGRVIKSVDVTTNRGEVLRQTDSAVRGRILVTPSGKFIITAGSTRNPVSVMDIESRKIVLLDGPHQSGSPSNFARNLTLNADGSRLLVALNDRRGTTICSYLTASWRKDICWFVTRGVFTLTAGFENYTLITSNALGAVEVWDVSKGVLLRSFQASGTALSSVALDHAGARLVTGEGGRLTVFDQKTQRLVKKGEDDAIRLWDFKSGKLISSLTVPEYVVGLAFSRNGQWLVMPAYRLGPQQASYSIYRSADLKEMEGLGNLGGPLVDAQFSPDGKRLAIASSTKIKIIEFSQK